jgi:hypothetical protein
MFERGDVTRVSNPSRVSSHRGSQQRTLFYYLLFLRGYAHIITVQ